MGTSSENLVDDSDTTSILNPVTAAELKGWYSFGFATEGYAALAIAIFFPIILEGLAANVAVESLDHSVACNVSVPQYDCSLEIGSNYVPTTSLVFYATTISVLIQFIVFISLGALADHGTHRKQFLMFFGYMTSIIGFCTLFVVSDSLWWMAFLIYILSNITFGASFVFFYAWVPILTRNDSRVIEASALSDTATYYKVSDTVGNEISSKGFAYGYLAAFVQLVIASGFAMLFGDGAKYGLTNYYGLQIGVAFSSVWAAVILWFYTQPLLDERPGPPLPPGENYILFSYKKRTNI